MIKAHILLMRLADGSLGAVAKPTAAEIAEVARMVRMRSVYDKVPVLAGDVLSTVGGVVAPVQTFRCGSPVKSAKK